MGSSNCKYALQSQYVERSVHSEVTCGEVDEPIAFSQLTI